jgi:hypothetical protein
MLQITEIWRYPIKSCRGFQVEQAWLDSRGLVGDRRWMLIDANGRMVTQRQYPKLAIVEVTEVVNWPLHSQARPGLLPLSITAPGMPELIVNPLTKQQQINMPLRVVKIWQDTCQACLAEDSAHQWFSDYLGQPTWLVEQPETMHRPIDTSYASRDGEGHYQQIAFSDGFPLLLISQASLDDLNLKLKRNTHSAEPIAMAHFRPNLVIAGCEAYAEDRAKQLVIHADSLQIFDIVKPCSRCVIPSINLCNGQIQQEPTRTLKTYRQGLQGDRHDAQIYFGQNLLLGFELITQTKQTPQHISVGSRAELRE